ncbi:hypothetical protein PIB30_024281, partial [Stylosanthes scabra]|nr:hypothetical protein [Stylosanthes scabra]
MSFCKAADFLTLVSAVGGCSYFFLLRAPCLCPTTLVIGFIEQGACRLAPPSHSSVTAATSLTTAHLRLSFVFHDSDGRSPPRRLAAHIPFSSLSRLTTLISIDDADENLICTLHLHFVTLLIPPFSLSSSPNSNCIVGQWPSSELAPTKMLHSLMIG